MCRRLPGCIATSPDDLSHDMAVLGSLSLLPRFHVTCCQYVDVGSLCTRCVGYFAKHLLVILSQFCWLRCTCSVGYFVKHLLVILSQFCWLRCTCSVGYFVKHLLVILSQFCWLLCTCSVDYFVMCLLATVRDVWAFWVEDVVDSGCNLCP